MGAGLGWCPSWPLNNALLTWELSGAEAVSGPPLLLRTSSLWLTVPVEGGEGSLPPLEAVLQGLGQAHWALCPCQAGGWGHMTWTHGNAVQGQNQLHTSSSSLGRQGLGMGFPLLFLNFNFSRDSGGCTGWAGRVQALRSKIVFETYLFRFPQIAVKIEFTDRTCWLGKRPTGVALPGTCGEECP